MRAWRVEDVRDSMDVKILRDSITTQAIHETNLSIQTANKLRQKKTSKGYRCSIFRTGMKLLKGIILYPCHKRSMNTARLLEAAKTGDLFLQRHRENGISLSLQSSLLAPQQGNFSKTSNVIQIISFFFTFEICICIFYLSHMKFAPRYLRI